MLLNKKNRNRITTKWQMVDQQRPPPADTVRRLYEVFRVEYTYNTNAIEGNTLSLRETQFVIEEGQTVRGKSLREIAEAKNQPEALEYLQRLVTNGKRIREADILTLHQIIMKDTIDSRYIGTYRKGAIGITGSKHVPPPAYDVPKMMEELVYELNNNPKELTTVELAAHVLHRTVYIHPFQDGNGRIARLLTNLILMKRRYPPIIILRADRAKYLNHLEKADKGNYTPLVNYVAQYVDKHLDLYLDALGMAAKDRKVSLRQAAKISQFSASYLRVLANRGLIPAVKEGRTWMIKESELFTYAKTHGKKIRKEKS